jgi:DNA-binding response OmpR family regulator
MAETPRRLLLVDDDPYLRILVSMALPGVELAEAARIDEAMELVGGDSFDALLIDRRLPDGDGLAIVRRLRKGKGPGREVPILIITSGHEEEQRKDVLAAGADEYLDKVTEVEHISDLAVRIERLLVLTPTERRTRRAGLVTRLKAGEVGDLDPPPPTESEPSASGRRRRWRRRGGDARDD